MELKNSRGEVRKVGDVSQGWVVEKILGEAQDARVIWSRKGATGVRYIVDYVAGPRGGLRNCHRGTLSSMQEAEEVARKFRHPSLAAQPVAAPTPATPTPVAKQPTKK